MARPYGAAHRWDMTVDGAMQEGMPHLRATGRQPVAAAAVAAAILLLPSTGFRFGIGDNFRRVPPVPDHATQSSVRALSP